MRRAASGPLLAALSVAPLAAQAQVFDSGWVVPDGTSCGATQHYEGKGSTVLTLVVEQDGTGAIQLTNSGWSAKDGEAYPLSVYLGRNSYDASGHGTTDTAGNHGFFFGIGSDFLSDLRAAGGMRVYRDDKLVDDLSLAGSAEAMRAIDRCLARSRAETAAAEHERRRFAHIADDPFATPPKPATAPTPLAEPEMHWITSDDYPAAGLPANWTGDVAYELQIEPSGEVASCFVTSGSGHEVLDNLTCHLIMRRAKFAADPTQKANRRVTGIQRWQP